MMKFINENKMTTFGLVFLANNVAANMATTGAFEVYLDDKEVFSKIGACRDRGKKSAAAIDRDVLPRTRVSDNGLNNLFC